MNPEAFARFVRGVARLPLAVKVWLGVLMAANGVAPLVFLTRREAQVTLVTFLASAALMMILTHVVGFTRLLGLGHLLWVLLLLYLWTRMGGHPAAQPYGAWIRLVMALNAASLVLDARDVVRYLRGDRNEMAPTSP